MSRRVVVGPDYDPDSGEVLHDAAGRPLSAEALEKLADEAEGGYDLSAARQTHPRRGRPSLAQGESPQVRFRLPADLRDRAADVAQREGKSLSQLARAALEDYVERAS